MKLGKIPGWLGLILIIGFMALTFLLIFRQVPQTSMEIVDRMINIIGTILGVAAGYHFKNSETDNDK